MLRLVQASKCYLLVITNYNILLHLSINSYTYLSISLSNINLNVFPTTNLKYVYLNLSIYISTSLFTHLSIIYLKVSPALSLKYIHPNSSCTRISPDLKYLQKSSNSYKTLENHWNLWLIIRQQILQNFM